MHIHETLASSSTFFARRLLNKYAALIALAGSCAVSLPAVVAADGPSGAPALFAAVAAAEIDPAPVEAFVVRTRTVRLILDIEGGADGAGESALARAEMLTLQLFPDVALLAMRTRAEALSPNSLVWTGMIDGSPPGLVSLSAVNGILVGHVAINGSRYRIAYAGNGLHRIQEINERALPQEASSPAS